MQLDYYDMCALLIQNRGAGMDPSTLFSDVEKIYERDVGNLRNWNWDHEIFEFWRKCKKAHCDRYGLTAPNENENPTPYARFVGDYFIDRAISISDSPIETFQDMLKFAVVGFQVSSLLSGTQLEMLPDTPRQELIADQRTLNFENNREGFEENNAYDEQLMSEGNVVNTSTSHGKCEEEQEHVEPAVKAIMKRVPTPHIQYDTIHQTEIIQEHYYSAEPERSKKPVVERVQTPASVNNAKLYHTTPEIPQTSKLSNSHTKSYIKIQEESRVPEVLSPPKHQIKIDMEVFAEPAKTAEDVKVTPVHLPLRHEHTSGPIAGYVEAMDITFDHEFKR